MSATARAKRQAISLKWPQPGKTDPKLDAKLDRLGTAPIAELRQQYVDIVLTDPPKAFGPDLLRRSIAYRLQERAYGGLTKETKRVLDQLVKQYLANPTGRLESPRRIKPGSVLVRIWNKKTYQVMVQDKGFAYEGRTYDSLSEIASLITGTKWNGPRFFGLRSKGLDNQRSAAGDAR